MHNHHHTIMPTTDTIHLSDSVYVCPIVTGVLTNQLQLHCLENDKRERAKKKKAKNL